MGRAHRPEPVAYAKGHVRHIQHALPDTRSKLCCRRVTSSPGESIDAARLKAVAAAPKFSPHDGNAGLGVVLYQLLGELNDGTLQCTSLAS